LVALRVDGRIILKLYLKERPEGKTPLCRSKSRWEDNIKIDLEGVTRGKDTTWKI
jgi:hypothetical protein